MESHNCLVTMNFASPEHANLAVQALSADVELQPKKVTRNLTVDGSTMCIKICAVDERMLRIAMSSFFDMALVVVKTLQEFGN
mmetsp:Transcript_7948/g.9948  ORF Transcript_7948/g.9948 Transcript_7948/m.9948 type:complete len:83 (-) Transcript_7948:537-785(-)|eukprot:CAMPEP_0185771366 /NCGR_PEP_ID=MMETSP1174-20130828/64257_1 /TAXON_ID=35687 /ORGANISM="Dictyocha speculum, Strain CCMP1381" /LENGTH=82 /DNA_ID=CAMNT_0028457223 /DNA_START=23 /DNA_END=271 /DNA_ORIENTATION=+